METPKSQETKTTQVNLRQQFPNTEKWNKILNEFLLNGPRGRHRRQFTYVNNSFTGKEAVEFMKEAIPKVMWPGTGRIASREQCSKLLQKFLEDKHFYRYGTHEGKANIFNDSNLLYCFYSVPKKPQTPTLLKRTSSFISKNIPLTSSPQFNKCIPTSPEADAEYNRRRSMSCSNLTDITHIEYRRKEPQVDATPPCDRTRDEGMYGSLKNSLIEKIAVRRRKPSPAPKLVAEPKLISQAVITTPPVLLSPKPTSPPSLVDSEWWSIYKKCLHMRLESLVGQSPIYWHIKGNDIKWNCENIEENGMVIPRYKGDTFSDYIMRLINYLMMFSNNHGSSIKFDEYQETKVFNVLCSNLEKVSPLLTDEESTAILQAIAHFKEISTELSYSIHKSHIPSYKPPRTRLRTPLPSVLYNNRTSTTRSTCSDLSSASSASYVSSTDSCSTYRGGVRLSIDELSEDENESFDNNSQFALSQYPPPYNLLYSNSTNTSHSTNNRENDALLSTIALLLISLPSTRRWKLHMILRLSSKVSSDENIRLDSRRANRELVLERMTKIIVPNGGSINSKQAMNIVKLLIDGVDDVFKVDSFLQSAVKQMAEDFQNQSTLTMRSPLSHPQRSLSQSSSLSPPPAAQLMDNGGRQNFFQRVVRKFL